MGVDIVYYIQKKENDQWKDIELFTKDNKRVEITRCGWDTLDVIKENWGIAGVTEKDVRELAEATGWMNDITDMPTYYWATLTKLELFCHFKKFNEYDTEEETEDIREFYKELIKEIEQYITFADEYYFNTDNIRIIAFIG